MNRHTLRAVLIIACAALCGGLLAACGEADDDPDVAAASSLRQSVAATSKLSNARLTASFELEPEGMIALGGPIAFRGSGPFATGAKGELPRFDFAIAGAIARQNLRARAISTGKRAFLTLGDRAYRIDQDFIDELLGHMSEHGAGLATLGLDPTTWIKDPQAKGSETVGGVQTTRVAGTIDVAKLLDDVAKLLEGSGIGGFLTPKLRAQIASAVKSSKVDVWTGAQDKILRQLAIVVGFAFETGASPIDGLEGGEIALRLRLDGVNATTVKPVAPKNAKPLGSLFRDGGLGALLPGLGAGAPRGRGDGGDAFLKCLSAAGSDTDAVAACQSKLAKP